VDLSATDRTGFTAVTEPRRAALDIPEILENVLRFLQFKTVFGVQRVCRQWKDLIASSPAIQEKLFLRLRNDTSETWMSMNSKSVPCNIRELPRDSELNFRMVNTVEVESGSWRHTAPGVKHLFKPVALNPLLSRTSTSVSSWREVAVIRSRWMSLRHTHLTTVTETFISPILRVGIAQLNLSSAKPALDLTDSRGAVARPQFSRTRLSR
jgi:hypothetical protein